MPVEFVAPPGIAKIEEHLSMKLNLHMLALSTIIGNTLYVCQAYTESQYRLQSFGDITIVEGTDNVDIIVKLEEGSIRYNYVYRQASVTSCTIYDENGKPLDADVKAVQATYEKLVDYCTALMVARMEAAAPATTETN